MGDGERDWRGSKYDLHVGFYVQVLTIILCRMIQDVCVCVCGRRVGEGWGGG